MGYSIIVNGAYGKMGSISLSTLEACADCQRVTAAGRDDNLAALIQQQRPDIVLDFTLPDAVFANTKLALEHDTRVVVGTSGLTPQQIEQLSELATKRSTGVIIAPNLSLSAALMIKYASQAAAYFEHAEITETHHRQKLDAPSGTALYTAHTMQPQLGKKNKASNNSSSTTNDSIPIHSLRLGGAFAEQEIILSNPHEQLHIGHRTSSRQAMMPGVLLACQKVLDLDHLVYGLDHIMDL